MSVIFSKSCEYAIQAVLFLASNRDSSPIHLRNIAESLNIPHHFLSKILQTLTHHEIVFSHKGSTGGFRLGRLASNITLIDIVRAVDGEAFLGHCVLGFPACGDDHPCPVHFAWKDSKSIIMEMLHNQTVEDLTSKLDGKLDLINSMAKRSQGEQGS